MRRKLLNIRNTKKKRNRTILLCTGLVLIGVIALLTGCMNIDNKIISSTPTHEKSTEHDSSKNSKETPLVNDESELDETELAEKIAEEQARILEVILFYGVGESQYVIETNEEAWEELLEKVSKKASEKESFKYLQKTRLEYDRAFYTDVVGVKLNEEQDKLIFTMLANLTQGISREFRLEVYMIKKDSEWKFEDFGSLYVEDYLNSPGKTIDDEVFLENHRNFK